MTLSIAYRCITSRHIKTEFNTDGVLQHDSRVAQQRTAVAHDVNNIIESSDDVAIALKSNPSKFRFSHVRYRGSRYEVRTDDSRSRRTITGRIYSAQCFKTPPRSLCSSLETNAKDEQTFHEKPTER
ncbi:uncharacterized protein LOC143357522 [Halictus rubicundus]|uniref:uncharacterized protein LOC143357522 n=1 Tax=Halictus rubicundus TaxID=77578 RepID=UPI00403528B6